MTAQEMFEELNLPLNEIHPFKDCLVYGVCFTCQILFDKTEKIIVANIVLTPKHIEAINKQCKELRWLDE